MNQTELAELLRDEHTFSKPCCVNETPDAHTVWLKIGNQSFCIDGYQETKKAADWMRFMLGKALANLVTNFKTSTPSAETKCSTPEKSSAPPGDPVL